MASLPLLDECRTRPICLATLGRMGDMYDDTITMAAGLSALKHLIIVTAGTAAASVQGLSFRGSLHNGPLATSVEGGGVPA